MLPVAQPRGRAGQQGAPADAAGGRLRAGHPAGHADRGDGQRRRQGHPGGAGRVGTPPGAGAADRHRLAVPGDHPADHRLRRSGCARDSPRDVVTVFIPEYVVGRWWENLLHNQSALRLKGRLLFEPGVMVTSVPWQLESSQQPNLDRLDATLSRGPARGPRGPRHPADAPAADAGRATSGPADGGGGGAGVLDAGRPRMRPDADGAGARPDRADRRPRSRTAGTAWAGHDGPGRLRPARAAGGAGGRRGHRGAPQLPARRRGRGARALAGPGRAAVPVRRTGPLRRLRPAARRAGRAARLEGRRRARAAGAARPGSPTRRSPTWAYG